MTERPAPKQAALKLVQGLHDDVSYDDIMHELYVLKKIERGLDDVENGRTKTHEEAREELSRWLK
jgi:predicted transcriptional regulator